MAEQNQIFDPVNHPAHYTQYEHEVIELTQHLSFCFGNAIKYLLRAGHKDNEIQDLKKALWYLNYMRTHQLSAFVANDDADYGTLVALARTFKNPVVDKLMLSITDPSWDAVRDAASELCNHIERLEECARYEERIKELEEKLSEAESARGAIWRLSKGSGDEGDFVDREFGPNGFDRLFRDIFDQRIGDLFPERSTVYCQTTLK